MDLTLRTDYWDDPAARSAFKRFLITIHGLDLSEWESRGYWDDAYTPYSFFHGDEIIASVCIYTIQAIINRKPARLAQLSGVGTLPEWRRRGLNRRLTEVALERAREADDAIFLFSDPDAIPFYEKCGFVPIDEYVESVEVGAVSKRDGIVRLDPGTKNDLDRIQEYATRRAPVSYRFSVLSPKLFMFHCLHSLRNHVYEIPQLDCLVMFERGEFCVSVFDIVSERILPWRDIYPFIASDCDSAIEFHFHTDKLEVAGMETRPLHGNHPFVKGTFPLERPVFPYTSRA